MPKGLSFFARKKKLEEKKKKRNNIYPLFRKMVWKEREKVLLK